MNLNARSILNKISDLETVLLEHEPDVVVISETWLSESIDSYEFLPPNYAACRKDRGSRGGGVAVVYKSCIPCVEIPSPTEVECSLCILKISGVYLLQLLRSIVHPIQMRSTCFPSVIF